MKTQIDLVQTYPYPVEAVWFALTDKVAISEWLMTTNDFEARVGAKFRLRSKPVPGWRGYVDCEVLEVIPRRLLAYSWVGDERRPPMRVTWTLEAVGGGTKLYLEHAGFAGMGGWVLAKLMMGPGWKKVLSRRLPGVLAARTKPRSAGEPSDPAHGKATV